MFALINRLAMILMVVVTKARNQQGQHHSPLASGEHRWRPPEQLAELPGHLPLLQLDDDVRETETNRQ